MTQSTEAVVGLLDGTLAAREALLDTRHESACRLFNGFSEGWPALVIDLYGTTIVLNNYADPPEQGEAAVRAAREFLLARLPWVRAVVVKTRHGLTADDRRGRLVHGAEPDRRVREHGVWYAIDVQLNRDAGLYLDTRELRAWAHQRLRGMAVLNTFAYTGSLGVAAKAGGAARVVHLDRNREFLNHAKASYALNGFPVARQDFQTGDFWTHVNRLKRAGERFDCVILDPPFFAATSKGVVDLAANSARLINKVRPLINDGGLLVAINNALFVSGRDYMRTLESLFADGYLRFAELIPVPPDFTGYPQTRVGSPITDPAPFNHSTKIAVLEVRRKAGNGAMAKEPGGIDATVPAQREPADR